MAKGIGKEVSVGIVVTIALLIFVVGIMSVGEESRFFARKVKYNISFPDSSGLRKGSPVNLVGVQIGSVSDIFLPIDPEVSGINIEISVDKRYESRIREGTKASLKYLQILSGEKYIELSAGKPEKPTLPVGSTIPIEEEMKIFETGENIAENLNEITNTLRTILEPIEKGEGIFGEMLTNPDFGKEGLTKIKEAANSMSIILKKIESGKGLLGKLIFDEETATDIIEIKDAVKKINSILDNIDKREGALGDLLTEGGKGEQAIEELKEAAEKINRIAGKLESKTGLFGRLLNDEEYSESVANDLKNLMANLSSITEKIDQGEGTVGAFINDPEIYEDLKYVVSGVKNSRMAKWMIKRYKKKGEKEAMKQAEREAEEKAKEEKAEENSVTE